MTQVILDADRLAKLDSAAECLGSTREEVLNQAIDKFTDYLAGSYDQWLARKVAKSIQAADSGRLVPSSEIDSWCEEMIANFAAGKTR